MTSLAGPTPIATPDDFPVEWDDPSDASLHWNWDQPDAYAASDQPARA